MKYIILIISVLLLLSGCGGPNPADFEREITFPTDGEPTYLQDTTVGDYRNETVLPESATQLNQFADQNHSGNLKIEINKTIFMDRTHKAVGYRDGVSGDPTRQNVTIQFISMGGYTALLVIHHLVGEYSAQAEFRITSPWDMELTLEGKNYSTKVKMPDGRIKPLILKTDEEGITSIILSNRTFYIREIPAVKSYEGDFIGGREVGIHKVLYGENLNAIAKKYKMTVQELKKLNGLKDNLIQPGDNLKVYVQ